MYITINSEFKPFTYDELTKPLQDYTEAYNKVEEQYATLAQQTEAWKNIATQENSPEAYAMYKKYSDELNAVVEDFSKGMTIQNRSKLSGLKSRYASEIIPIANAASRLQELIDERAKEERRDPTLKYERSMDDINIDKLIKNPFLNYGKSYSGALIEQQASTAASALAKNMREDPKGWQKILGNQYYQRKIQKGYTPEEVLLASLGDPNAPKELQEIMTKAITTSGIESWEGYFDNEGNITQRGQSILSDVRTFAGRGLSTAVGGTEYERVSNKAYDYVMQAALKKEKNTPLIGNGAKNPKIDVPLSEETKEKSKKLATLKQFDSDYTSKTSWRPASPTELFSYITNQNDSRIPTPLLNAGNKTPIYGVDYGAMRRETTFVNPIREYEKAQEYKPNTSTVSPTSTVRFNSMVINDPYLPSYGPTEYSKNYNANVITQDQYEALKELGYDSNSTAEDFSQLQQRIDEAIKHRSPISINLSNYTREEEALARKLSENNMEGNIHEYKGNGKLGKVASYEDLFKIDENGVISFKNPAEFGVDPYNLDNLFIQTGGKNYSVRATLLFPEIGDILNNRNIREAYEMGDQNVKDEIIQSLSFIYQDLMNNYDQRMPATSSQATYGYPY